METVQTRRRVPQAEFSRNGMGFFFWLSAEEGLVTAFEVMNMYVTGWRRPPACHAPGDVAVLGEYVLTPWIDRGRLNGLLAGGGFKQ